MRLFWQIIGKIANCMIRKKEVAGTRIWGSKGHCMGLNLGVFLQIGVYKGTDFWAGQLDGFTGVFLGSASGSLRLQGRTVCTGGEEAAVPDYHFPRFRQTRRFASTPRRHRHPALHQVRNAGFCDAAVLLSPGQVHRDQHATRSGAGDREQCLPPGLSGRPSRGCAGS